MTENNSELPVFEVASIGNDFPVQRKIAGYLTREDPEIFKGTDTAVVVGDYSIFMHQAASGEYGAERLTEMLKLLQEPDLSNIGYLNYAYSFLENDQDVVDVVATMVGKGGGENITKEDVLDLRHKFETPVEYFTKIQKALGKGLEEPEENEALRRAAVQLARVIYGEREKYFEQFGLMQTRALAEAQQASSSAGKKGVSGRKLARNAAAWVLTVGGGLGTGYVAADIIKDGHFDGPFYSVPSSGQRQESDAENSVEYRFNIEILDIREAYDKLGKPFELYDSNELGNHPPTRWSDDQIGLLAELLPKLPSTFYKENPGGTPLGFTLTDYGKDCPCAGTYDKSSYLLSGREPIVMLSDSNFSPQNKQWAFRLLTHELAHRVDFQEMNNSLWPKIDEILGPGTFSDVRNIVVPILDKYPDPPEALKSVKDALRYGFMGINNTGLNSPVELTAVLAQIYVGGKDEFMLIGNFVGEERAQKLYDLMKTEMFGGLEYHPEQTSEPVPEPNPSEQPPSQETELNNLMQEYGITIVNPYNIEMTPDQLRHFGQILSIFPKNFYSVVNNGGWGNITIVLADGTGHVPGVWPTSPLVEWGGAVIESTDGTPYYNIQVENMSSFFAEQLSHNAPVGSIREIPPDALRTILGGNELFNNPLKVLPNLKRHFKNSSSEELKEAILNIENDYMYGEGALKVLMGSYLGGRTAFFKDVVPVFGRKKANEAYRLITGMYSGQEFSGNFIDGIPVPRPVNQ